MALSRACYHDMQYFFNVTPSAVIPQKIVFLLTWGHYSKPLLVQASRFTRFRQKETS